MTLPNFCDMCEKRLPECICKKEEGVLPSKLSDLLSSRETVNLIIWLKF